MPPVKRRAKGAKAPPNRWTRAEIDVLLQCLGSDEFLSKHAKTLQKRQFPPFSLRDACVKENEYHGVCVALSQEILNQAGDHNNFNLRPFASIASKILDMTAKAKASNQGLEAQMLFDAFDVDAFMASSGPLGPEPPAAADLAAASSSGAASSSTSKGWASTVEMQWLAAVPCGHPLLPRPIHLLRCWARGASPPAAWMPKDRMRQ